MSEFDPDRPHIEVWGSDGSRFLQEGRFYGGPPHFRLIPPESPTVQGEEDPLPPDEPPAEPDGALPDEPPDEPLATDPAVESYTLEQLEALSVAGLREIATKYGVKGRSKDDLIAEILAAQAKAAAE